MYGVLELDRSVLHRWMGVLMNTGLLTWEIRVGR